MEIDFTPISQLPSRYEIVPFAIYFSLRNSKAGKMRQSLSLEAKINDA